MTITLPDTDAVDEHGYVPVISLAGLDDPARRGEVAGQLGAALRRSGFYVAVDHIAGLLRFVVPRSVREGRSYLTVALGCTGGQHRSVYLVEELARHFQPQIKVLVRHRELLET